MFMSLLGLLSLFLHCFGRHKTDRQTDKVQYIMGFLITSSVHVCRFDGCSDTGHRRGRWNIHLRRRNVRHSKVRETLYCVLMFIKFIFSLKQLKGYTLGYAWALNTNVYSAACTINRVTAFETWEASFFKCVNRFAQFFWYTPMPCWPEDVY